MKANDIPVTDAELNQFYGVAEVDTSAADVARRAIRAISKNDLTPEVVDAILQTLTAQIQSSNWKHTDKAENALEYLDDAMVILTEEV